jgi:hypothetical protein
VLKILLTNGNILFIIKYFIYIIFSAFCDSDMMTINVRCVVETRDSSHARQLLQHLANAKYVVELEIGSLHILPHQQQEQQRAIKIESLENQQQNELASSTTFHIATETHALVRSTSEISLNPNKKA